jgi:hypothetical protein
MIYEASLYYDKINARERGREGFGSQAEQWRVFPTEQEAKDFIIRRARIKLENAEAELRRCKRALAKVVKRFGTPCAHGIADPEQCGLCADARSPQESES